MSLAVLAATTQFKHRFDAPPAAVWGALLLVFGLASGVMGWYGWRHADQLVPTSLGDGEHKQRARVLRRGAVAFVIVGVALVAAGIVFVGGGG